MTRITPTMERKAVALIMDYLGADDADWTAFLRNETNVSTYGRTDDPVFYFEAGPYEWAIEASAELQDAMGKIGVFCEPVYSFALGLYRA